MVDQQPCALHADHLRLCWRGLFHHVSLLAHRVTKGGKPTLIIESGDLALDTKSLEEILGDMGATGKSDEVIKIPGNSVRLLVFTGLGKASSHYGHELLRRAAGAASRTLSNQKSATFALPAHNLEGVSAVAQGAALGAYLFNEFRSDEVVTSNSSLASAKRSGFTSFKTMQAPS